jgi:hypothetical protein
MEAPALLYSQAGVNCVLESLFQRLPCAQPGAHARATLARAWPWQHHVKAFADQARLTCARRAQRTARPRRSTARRRRSTAQPPQVRRSQVGWLLGRDCLAACPPRELLPGRHCSTHVACGWHVVDVLLRYPLGVSHRAPMLADAGGGSIAPSSALVCVFGELRSLALQALNMRRVPARRTWFFRRHNASLRD